jgi:hypothetical protein
MPTSNATLVTPEASVHLQHSESHLCWNEDEAKQALTFLEPLPQSLVHAPGTDVAVFLVENEMVSYGKYMYVRIGDAN